MATLADLVRGRRWVCGWVATACFVGTAIRPIIPSEQAAGSSSDAHYGIDDRRLTRATPNGQRLRVCRSILQS